MNTRAAAQVATGRLWGLEGGLRLGLARRLSPLRACVSACGGGSVEAMAQRLGVSPDTVKKQLQAVYDKTQARRQQADLLKLLLALATR